MNTKALTSITLIALASTALGYGTYAAFTTEAESIGNMLGAGQLGLTVDGQPAISSFLQTSNLIPTQKTNGSVTLLNTGTVYTGDADGHVVFLLIGAKNDNLALARYFNLTSITYDGTNVLSGVTDVNGNGYKDLADLETSTLKVSDPGITTGKVLFVEVQLGSTVPNSYQGLMNEVDFTFTLSHEAMS